MVKKILLSVLNFIFRVSVAAAVVVLVYRLAMYSYHFGYMVFADASMEPSPGRDIIVTIDSTENIMDVGRILKSRGLISDEKIFMVQERLSDFHGKLVPGTYTLNTSMKSGEMLQIMGEAYVEEGEEGSEDQDGQETGNGSKDDSLENDGFYDPMTGEFLENGIIDSPEGTDTTGEDEGQSQEEQSGDEEQTGDGSGHTAGAGL